MFLLHIFPCCLNIYIFNQNKKINTNVFIPAAAHHMEQIKMLIFHGDACGLSSMCVLFPLFLNDNILQKTWKSNSKNFWSLGKIELFFTLNLTRSPFESIYWYSYGKKHTFKDSFSVMVLLVLYDCVKAIYIFEVWLLGYLYSINFKLLFLVMVG